MNGGIGVYMISCIFQITSISLFSPWLMILKINSKFGMIFPLETQTSSASIMDTAKHHFPNIFHYPYNNSANKWQLNEEKICAEDPDKYSVVRKTSYIQPFMFDGYNILHAHLIFKVDILQHTCFQSRRQKKTPISTIHLYWHDWNAYWSIWQEIMQRLKWEECSVLQGCGDEREEFWVIVVKAEMRPCNKHKYFLSNLT